MTYKVAFRFNQSVFEYHWSEALNQCFFAGEGEE